MFPMPNFGGDGGARFGGMPTTGPKSDMSGVGTFDFGGSGQNQYMNYPSMTSPGFPMPSMSQDSNLLGTMTTPTQQNNLPPGIVPPSSNQPPLGPRSNPGDTASAGVGARLPGQMYQGRTIDPQLTEQLAQWLMGQLGQGATPFDLSALLPSTGGATTPGSLTAPENPILQSLQQFYTSGTGGPLPGVLPMWQSEMKSMEIPIQQQLANIKEQFGARGALGSTEMATALEQFGSQTAADQESLLGQLTLQALPGMEQFGASLQQEDQASIDRLYQEFIRTQPEYSPLLGEEFGMGTLFPPMYSNKKGAFGEAFMGSLGQSLGTLGLNFGPKGFSGASMGGG